MLYRVKNALAEHRPLGFIHGSVFVCQQHLASTGFLTRFAADGMAEHKVTARHDVMTLKN